MKRNVSIQMGIWSVILCSAVGLATEIRPYIILGRALISFAISAMLGYILVSVIERYVSTGVIHNAPTLPSSPALEQSEGEGTDVIYNAPTSEEEGQEGIAVSNQQSAVSEEQADC